MPHLRCSEPGPSGGSYSIYPTIRRTYGTCWMSSVAPRLAASTSAAARGIPIQETGQSSRQAAPPDEVQEDGMDEVDAERGRGDPVGQEPRHRPGGAELGEGRRQADKDAKRHDDGGRTQPPAEEHQVASDASRGD